MKNIYRIALTSGIIFASLASVVANAPFTYADTGVTISSPQQSIYVGPNAGAQLISSGTTALINSIAIGQNALQTATSSLYNTAIGPNALANIADDTNGGAMLSIGAPGTQNSGSYNVGIGYNALAANTIGFGNIAIGANSLVSNLDSNTNIAIGFNSLGSNALQAQGNHNIAIGSQTLPLATAGYNLGIGDAIMKMDTTGGNNIVLGTNGLKWSTSPTQNIAIGHDALVNASSTSSIAIGQEVSGFGGGLTFTAYPTIGDVYIGDHAAYNAATSSDYNTFLGFQSGYDVTTGNDNILLGANVNTGGSHLTTGANDICISYNCILPGGATTTNALNIGNLLFGIGLTATSSSTSIPTALTGLLGISTSSPSSTLTVDGNLYVTNNNAPLGYSVIGTPNVNGGTPGPQDTFVVGTSTTSTIASRAMAITVMHNSSTTAQVLNGLNAFEVWGSGSTGNQTAANATGGGLRSRYVASNVSTGYNTAQMSAISAGIAVAGIAASSTDDTNYHSEAPLLASGNLITNFRGFWQRAAAPSGTLVNQAGIDIENLTSGTNNTLALLGTAAIPAGNFGIYDASANANYFAGNVGVGTTSPFAKLSVFGTGQTNAPLFAISTIIANATTTVFSVDATGHITTGGTKPTLSSCGTTNSISGNDENGTITFAGTLVSSCTMTRATPVPAGTQLDCQVTVGGTGAFAGITSISSTAVVFGLSAPENSGTLYYRCDQHIAN